MLSHRFKILSCLISIVTIGTILTVFCGMSTAADKVRVGYTSPAPTHSVLWVAEVGGFFKKNNLEVEIIYMPGNISIPSLMSGEIQLGQMTGALMSPARLQGGDQ